MEVVGSSGAVYNLHVYLFIDFLFALNHWGVRCVAQLKESLNARTRVFWSLAIKAVRQQQNEAVFNIPFGFPRSEELVDNDLGAISEISKLSFP